jgi:hypothetical protein
VIRAFQLSVGVAFLAIVLRVTIVAMEQGGIRSRGVTIGPTGLGGRVRSRGRGGAGGRMLCRSLR